MTIRVDGQQFSRPTQDRIDPAAIEGACPWCGDTYEISAGTGDEEKVCSKCGQLLSPPPLPEFLVNSHFKNAQALFDQGITEESIKQFETTLKKIPTLQPDKVKQITDTLRTGLPTAQPGAQPTSPSNTQQNTTNQPMKPSGKRIFAEITVIPYTKDLHITNLEALGRGTGARFLLAVYGPSNILIAKQWKRSLPKKLSPVEVLVDFKPTESKQGARIYTEGGVYSDPSAAHEKAMKLKNSGWGDVKVTKRGDRFVVAGVSPEDLKRTSHRSISMKIYADEVVNPVTKDALMQTFNIKEDLAEEIEAILDMTSGDDDAAYKALQDIDKLVGTFGVESITGEHSGRNMSYLNTGETYQSTIIFDDKDGFYIGSYGDWVEEVEGKSEYENSLAVATQNVMGVLEDVLSGSEVESSVFVGPEDPDLENLGHDFWKYLWDNYASIGEVESVSDLADDPAKALEFLRNLGWLEAKED